jgi:hypothetical protein
MPAKRLWLSAAVFLIPTLAQAGGDVGYQLEVQVNASNIDSGPLTRDSIALQDRTWATPGVEQATLPLGPPTTFDFARGATYRFHFDGDGPSWLDDVCFPLTRQLFHSCELPRPYFSQVLCDDIHTRKQDRPSPFDLYP